MTEAAPQVPEAPEITIESGIPIPQNAGRPARYPFAAMRPGDSFFVPGKKSVSVPKKDEGGRWYATRRVTEADVDGVRVWRVE